MIAMGKLTTYPFRGKAIENESSLPESPARSPVSSPPPIPATLSSNPKLAAQVAAQADDKNIVRRKLTGYVGFANLPNQWHRKSVRKGFNFNVMVVGTFLSHFYLLEIVFMQGGDATAAGFNN